jgi:PAS domain S-box-containing protein
MTPSPISARAPRSIRAHLIALIVAVALPLLALLGWASYRGYRASVSEARNTTLALAEAAAVSTQEMLAVSEDLMHGIATQFGPTLLDGTPCDGLVQAVNGVFRFLINVIVADAEGSIVCSAVPIPDSVAPTVAHAPWFQRIEETTLFTVGPPTWGPMSETWVVALAVPLLSNDGAFRGVIAGSLPLLQFQDLLGGVRLDGDELVTIATESGIVVARSRDAEAWVGRRLPPGTGEREVGPGHWVGDAPDGDRQQRAWGRVEIPTARWRVYVGLPARAVYGPALRAASRSAIIVLLILALATVFASSFYRRIIGSLEDLVDRIRAGMQGEIIDMPARAPSEFREVMRQFKAAVDGRTRAESSERSARERYQSVFDNAVFGIYVSTTGGDFLEVNPALVQMLGYESEQELYAAGARTLYRDPSVRRDLVKEYRGATIIDDLETEWLRRDGVPIMVRLNGKVIHTDEGEPAFEVIVEDITAERRREEELRQTQKMEAVGRLAGGVAHDFNNLLTVIGGNLELLQGSLPEDHPALVDVEQIADATGRATALTRQLLSFSRKDAGESATLDLNEVLTDLEKMLARLIREDVILETRLDPAPQLVLGDSGQIEQIVMNLVLNARDAIDGAGRIVVRTLGVPEGWHELGSGVVLTVQDDGLGMDVETRSRIFEPFFTTKEKGQGTGLGLATVYGIVRQYGGHVRVESELGVGTIFEIWLPASQGFDDARPDRALEGDGASMEGHETVLVVEDEDLVRKIVRRVLEDAGYQILVATDGEEALELVDAYEGAIDLVVSDVVMPRLKGPEMAVRLELRRPGTPVLFMSGYTDNYLVEDRFSRDPALFIAKPFSPTELCARVRRILDRRYAKT